MCHVCDVTRVVTQSSPFLFCFIVEFSLVGSTVFYNTWRNVHTLTRSAQTCNPYNPVSRYKHLVIPCRAEVAACAGPLPRQRPRRPNLRGALAKTNWSHSRWEVVSCSH